MAIQKTAEPAKAVKVNEVKWGKATVDVGWSLVPNILLMRQAVLGLDPVDVNILLHILKHWWEADDLPFPEMKTISTAMAVSRSTVQRHIRKMEVAGFIRRIYRKPKNGGNTSNKYDFSGLVTLLRPYAEEELSAKVEKAEDERAKLTPRGHRRRLKSVK